MTCSSSTDIKYVIILLLGILDILARQVEEFGGPYTKKIVSGNIKKSYLNKKYLQYQNRKLRVL